MPVHRLAATALSLALLLPAACAAPRPARTPPPAIMTATAPGPAPAPEEPAPRLRLPGDVRPIRQALELTVVPSAPGFEGKTELELQLDRPRRVLWLNARGLEVSAAEVEAGGVRRPAAFRQVGEDGVARLELEAPIGPGRALVRLAWRGTWAQVVGIFRWQDRGDWYAATQFEPLDARRAFPCLDEPGFKIPWDVTVVAPEGLALAGNTPEVEASPAGPGLRRVRFATTRPLPSYLLFVAVGPFDVVSAPIPPNQVRDRVLPQRGFAPKGRGAELGFGLEASTALTAALERWTGIPFPFEKLDHVMLSGFPGAMENAGAVAYDETTFLYQPGVTPRGHRRDIASIVAHEVGHQWFGDLVTLDWWTDTWLNESFATFIDPRMVAGWRADWRPELDGLQETGWIMAEDGLASARSISQPLEQPSDVLGQFDGMSYQKGAAVLTMFEGWIGPERFRDGVRAFLAAHQDGTATRADFLAALSTAAGRDLAPSLSTFLDQPGVPLLTTEVACAAGGAEVRLRQARWQPAGATPAAAARWLLPVCVRGQARGQPFERCTLLEEAEGTLPIPEGCPEWLLPNASAAGYYRFTLPSRDLARLLDRGLPRLTVAEKIALLGNLRAAEQAGVLPYADLLATTVRLAADADEDVVRATLQVLEAADRVLLDDPGREPLRALSRRLYGPRLERLGWAPAPDELERVSRLRVRLVEHLALTAREPQARAELARRGARLLGLDGQPADAAPVDPDLARVALRVVLQDRGAPAFDAAWAALPSTRGALRQALVSAYQAATDPALVARAGTLWRTAGLSPMERFALAQAGSGQPENTPALLARLERELPEVVAATPEGMVGWLPGGLAGLQGPGDGARLRALFEPQVAAHPEVARPLAQALEGIAINLAARARREEVGAAYRAAAR